MTLSSTAIRSCGLAAIFLTAHAAAAAPTIIQAERRIEVGADGPGDPGFSDRLDTTALDRFNERVLGSGTVNGGFLAGNASQFSSFTTDPTGVGFTATGVVQLSADPSSEADRFAGLAVSTLSFEVQLTSPGEIAFFYNMSARPVPLPGQPAMFATAAIRIIDLDGQGQPTLFSDLVDGSDSASLTAGDNLTLDLAAGRYEIEVLALAGVFQGETLTDIALLPPDGVNLLTNYSIGATIVPAPATWCVTLVPLSVTCLRRRRYRRSRSTT